MPGSRRLPGRGTGTALVTSLLWGGLLAAFPAAIVAQPSIDAGAGAGAPGSSAFIAVTLTSNGATVVATANDLHFDDALLQPVGCTINPAIGDGSALKKTLVTGSLCTDGSVSCVSDDDCPAPNRCDVLRVGVFSIFNVDVIPDGLLFTCEFSIAADASPATLGIGNTAEAADAQGNDLLDVGGADGSLTITGAVTPTPTPPGGTPAVDVGFVSAAAGESAAVPVTLSKNGAAVVATANDIHFDNAVLSLDLPNACTINPVIGAGTTPNKSLFAETLCSDGATSCSTDTDCVNPNRCDVLRVAIVGLTNTRTIPDGILYTCQFAVAAAAPSGTQVLRNSAGTSDSLGNDLVTTGSAGGILIGAAFPTPTPTPLPVPPAVDVGSVSAVAGEIAAVPVTLSKNGAMVAATANDIQFDNAVLSVATPDACAINPAIGAGTTANKSLFAQTLCSDATVSCSSDLDCVGSNWCNVLRVAIVGLSNTAVIPDGMLYTCQFAVAANAASGMRVLSNSPGASDPLGNDLATNGSNGSILISTVPSPTVRLSTATPTSTTTATHGPVATATPSYTALVVATASNTAVPATATPTNTASATDTATASATGTATATETPTVTPTASASASPTPTSTVTPEPDGSACTAGTECLSGFCVDAVCCGSAACGARQRCDVFGAAGACSEQLPGGKQCRRDSDCESSACVPGTPSRCANVIRPTPTPTTRPCVGDCDGDGTVAVPELVGLLRVALGAAPRTPCQTAGPVRIEQLLTAINNAESRCGALLTAR